MELKRKILKKDGGLSTEFKAEFDDKTLSIIGENWVETDAEIIDKNWLVLWSSKWGWISREKIAERNEYIIGLYVMGLSAKTILNQVNKAAIEKWWGILDDDWSIRKIVSKYFKDKIPDWNARVAYFEWLKEASYSQQENLIEKMALHIRNKSNWKEFEYQDALEKLFKMQQSLIENRNWNDSRANPLINISNTTNQLNVFTEWKSLVDGSPQANQVIGRLLGKLGQKFEDDKTV